MTSIETLADRLAIRELIDEYSNVCTRQDWDRLPALLTDDCAWRTRGTHARDVVGRAAVVEAIRAVVEGYGFVFQMPHAPRIALADDQATATTLINEVVKSGAETGRFVLAIYHDAFRRVDGEWRFSERVFRGTYIEEVAMPGRTDFGA